MFIIVIFIVSVTAVYVFICIISSGRCLRSSKWNLFKWSEILKQMNYNARLDTCKVMPTGYHSAISDVHISRCYGKMTFRLLCRNLCVFVIDLKMFIK